MSRRIADYLIKNLRMFCLQLLIIILAALVVLPVFAQGMTADREREVNDRLEEILSSGEFTDPQNDKSIFERIGEMIKDFFSKIRKAFSDEDDNQNSVFSERILDRWAGGTVLKIFSVCLILVFVFLLFYFVSRNFHISKRIMEKEDAQLLSILKDSATVERDALEFCSRGDFRQGLRFLYIAGLLRLNETNIIRIDKSKTNKQYLKEVLDKGFPHYNMIQEFTRDFNWYWYGNKDVDKSKFDYWYQKYTSVLKEGIL
jgi:hypothetical protein